MRILIVEDDPSLAESLNRCLKEEKYSVQKALSFNEAKEALDFLWDAILLDWELGDNRNGLELLPLIKQRLPDVPVIMLTAHSHIEDKVTAFDTGVDDYLTKPFGDLELLARLRSLLRRKHRLEENVIISPPLILDIKAHEITCEGKKVDLTLKEFQILTLLLYNRGRVISRLHIAEHLSDSESVKISNLVDVHIKNIRKKIDDNDSTIIQTVRGLGYVIRKSEK